MTPQRQIIALRKVYTLEKLAHLLKCSLNSVHRWEYGRGVKSQAQRDLITDLYNREFMPPQAEEGEKLT